MSFRSPPCRRKIISPHIRDKMLLRIHRNRRLHDIYHIYSTALVTSVWNSEKGTLVPTINSLCFSNAGLGKLFVKLSKTCCGAVHWNSFTCPSRNRSREKWTFTSTCLGRSRLIGFSLIIIQGALSSIFQLGSFCLHGFGSIRRGPFCDIVLEDLGNRLVLSTAGPFLKSGVVCCSKGFEVFWISVEWQALLFNSALHLVCHFAQFALKAQNWKRRLKGPRKWQTQAKPASSVWC